MASARLTFLVLCLMTPAVAGAVDGGVCLYLQPFPSEASRLAFVIATVSAVTSSGAEHPLDVRLRDVNASEAGRQRLLASGNLPTGSYSGFLIRVARAGLRDARGEATLLVPDTPVRVDFRFEVSSRRTPLLWLDLKFQASLSDGVAFSPAFLVLEPTLPIAGNAGFVANEGSDSITVFDKHLGQAVAMIGTCSAPAGMALDQPRRRLYVACSKDDEVLSVDVATGAIIERVRLSPGDRPRELTLAPDGSTLVSVNAGSGSVGLFNTSPLVLKDKVNVGNGPGSALVDPSGRRAFVFNTRSSSISVVDLASRSLVATVSTDSAPTRGQINVRGDRLYVIHERSPYMTVMDPRQLTLISRARLRTAAGAIEIDRVRGLLCLGSSRDTTVEFYDPNALMPLYGLRTKAGVSLLKVDVEDNNLYMVNPDTRSLVVGRLTDRRVSAEIDVGDRPYWVAVMGER